MTAPVHPEIGSAADRLEPMLGNRLGSGLGAGRPSDEGVRDTNDDAQLSKLCVMLLVISRLPPPVPPAPPQPVAGP